MSAEGKSEFPYSSKQKSRRTHWKKRKTSIQKPHIQEAVTPEVSLENPIKSPPTAQSAEDIKGFPEIVEAVLKVEPKVDEEKQSMSVKEKVREQTVLYSLLEAKLRVVAEQLNFAKNTKQQIELEKPILERELQVKTKEISKLTEECGKTSKTLQELTKKLQNREIARKNLEAESRELQRFLMDKDKELFGLKENPKPTKVNYAVQTVEVKKEKPKLITISQVAKVKAQIDQVNSELKPKEELLAYAYKRHNILLEEKNVLARQLAELRNMFQCLKGNSISNSTEGLKDELYEIIKDKNQMEIELGQSKLNSGFYKVSTLIIVFLY